MKRTLFQFGGLMMVAGVVSVLVGCGSKTITQKGSANEFKASGEVGVEVGDIVSEIDGKDIDGNPFKLSDYRGKVVMLDFWAST